MKAASAVLVKMRYLCPSGRGKPPRFFADNWHGSAMFNRVLQYFEPPAHHDKMDLTLSGIWHGVASTGWQCHLGAIPGCLSFHFIDRLHSARVHTSDPPEPPLALGVRQPFLRMLRAAAESKVVVRHHPLSGMYDVIVYRER